MGRLDGRRPLSPAQPRGQGRSHAIRLAEEGAVIIAVDISRDVAAIPSPPERRMSSQKRLSWSRNSIGALSPPSPTSGTRPLSLRRLRRESQTVLAWHYL